MRKNINKRVTRHAYAKMMKSFYMLDYYPYGPKTKWDYWLCGKVDLRNAYKMKQYKHMTALEVLYSITEEVSRALSYHTLRRELDKDSFSWGSNQQWFHAQAMHRLFYCGDMGWTKEPIKGKTDSEIEKLEEKNGKLYYLWLASPMPKKSEDTIKYHRKKYGLFEVRHLPLIQHSARNGKRRILYTKQQLCAIDLLVTCEFENCC